MVSLKRQSHPTFLFYIVFCVFILVRVNCHYDHNRSSSNRLAFGSCAKQYKLQPFWDNILQLQPDGWLWMGDAIYASMFLRLGVGLKNVFVHFYAVEELLSVIFFMTAFVSSLSCSSFAETTRTLTYPNNISLGHLTSYCYCVILSLVWFLRLFPVSFVDCSNTDCLKEGYEMMRSKPQYQHFLQQISFIDGTWDDHDYGINDGGKEFQFKTESQSLFLDFLDVPKDSPRRFREGVFTSKLFSLHDPSVSKNKQYKRQHVKLILLDVRSHREQSYIPSIAQHRIIPLSGVIAAVVRLLTSLIG